MPGKRWFYQKVQMQGAQKIIIGAIHELPLRVRRNDEVAAQSRSERDR